MCAIATNDMEQTRLLDSLSPQKDAKSYDPKIKVTAFKICTRCGETKHIQAKYKNGRCDACRVAVKKENEIIRFEQPTQQSRTRDCRACKTNYVDNNRNNGCCSSKCLQSITPEAKVHCAECGTEIYRLRVEPNVTNFNTTCRNSCREKFEQRYEDELYNRWVSTMSKTEKSRLMKTRTNDEVIVPILPKSYTGLHKVRMINHADIRSNLLCLAYKSRHDKKFNTNLRILALKFQQQFLNVETKQTIQNKGTK